MRSFVAIAEPSADGGTWWISFPGLPGVTSAADRPEEIASQARDALASAELAGVRLPPAIEDAGVPHYDLNDYENPLILLVPLDVATPVPA
jgi:hypothetical protein